MASNHTSIANTFKTFHNPDLPPTERERYSTGWSRKYVGLNGMEITRVLENRSRPGKEPVDPTRINNPRYKSLKAHKAALTKNAWTMWVKAYGHVYNLMFAQAMCSPDCKTEYKVWYNDHQAMLDYIWPQPPNYQGEWNGVQRPPGVNDPPPIIPNYPMSIEPLVYMADPPYYHNPGEDEGENPRDRRNRRGGRGQPQPNNQQPPQPPPALPPNNPPEVQQDVQQDVQQEVQQENLNDDDFGVFGFDEMQDLPEENITTSDEIQVESQEESDRDEYDTERINKNLIKYNIESWKIKVVSATNKIFNKRPQVNKRSQIPPFKIEITLDQIIDQSSSFYILLRNFQTVFNNMTISTRREDYDVYISRICDILDEQSQHLKNILDQRTITEKDEEIIKLISARSTEVKNYFPILASEIEEKIITARINSEPEQTEMIDLEGIVNEIEAEEDYERNKRELEERRKEKDEQLKKEKDKRAAFVARQNTPIQTFEYPPENQEPMTEMEIDTQPSLSKSTKKYIRGTLTERIASKPSPKIPTPQPQALPAPPPVAPPPTPLMKKTPPAPRPPTPVPVPVPTPIQSNEPADLTAIIKKFVQRPRFRTVSRSTMNQSQQNMLRLLDELSKYKPSELNSMEYIANVKRVKYMCELYIMESYQPFFIDIQSLHDSFSMTDMVENIINNIIRIMVLLENVPPDQNDNILKYSILWGHNDDTLDLKRYKLLVLSAPHTMTPIRVFKNRNEKIQVQDIKEILDDFQTNKIQEPIGNTAGEKSRIKKTIIRRLCYRIGQKIMHHSIIEHVKFTNKNVKKRKANDEITFDVTPVTITIGRIFTQSEKNIISWGGDMLQNTLSSVRHEINDYKDDEKHFIIPYKVEDIVIVEIERDGSSGAKSIRIQWRKAKRSVTKKKTSKR